MDRKDRMDLKGALLLGGFSVLMGVNHTTVKLVSEGMAPILQAGLRSAIAFPVVLAFALVARRRLSLTDGTFWPGLFCGMLFAAEFLALFLALDRTTVGRTAVLFYTMPFWVAVAAHYLIPGERLTPRRVGGLLLALSGVALALGDKAGGGSLEGDLLALAAALAWAGIALTARLTRLSEASPEMQLLYQLAVASVVLLALAPLETPMIRDLTAAHLGMILFQAVVIIAMGFLMWFWILKVYPASDMAAFGFLSPLFAMLFGWAVLDEPLTSALLGAMALVGLGIFLVAWKPRRDTPPA